MACGESPIEAAAPFDESMFEKVLSVPALQVPARSVSTIQKDTEIKEFIFRQRGIQNVVGVEGDRASKLVLLKPEVEVSAPPDCVRRLLEAGDAKLVTRDVRFGYQHLTADQALQKLLPAGVDAPRGFETVGHLAHFNLRDQHWPHRFIIGRVILDKNPCIHTVVTKVGALSNEFRTFDMEVIAGREDTAVSVTEHGLKLRFDFRRIYWNSKLSEERLRVLAQVEPEDIVCDLFAGVGCFSLLCAAKGCKVFSNDLNPAGSEAISRNAALNGLDVEVSNLCARKCVLALGQLPLPAGAAGVRRVHSVMNLPELALDFLDAFRSMAASRRSEFFQGCPVELLVHCYCFAREKERPELEINPRVVAALGVVPEGMTIREVRDVAPKKNMYCVEFRLPLQAAAHALHASVEAAGAVVAAGDESQAPPAKRARVEDART